MANLLNQTPGRARVSSMAVWFRSLGFRVFASYRVQRQTGRQFGARGSVFGDLGLGVRTPSRALNP